MYIRPHSYLLEADKYYVSASEVSISGFNRQRTLCVVDYSLKNTTQYSYVPFVRKVRQYSMAPRSAVPTLLYGVTYGRNSVKFAVTGRLGRWIWQIRA